MFPPPEQNILQNELHQRSKIFVSGHRGLVGSAIVRHLTERGYRQLCLADRQQLDLRQQPQVDEWFASQRPEYVIHAAGKVGGIKANSEFPADFVYDNLLIQATVLRAAWQFGVKKLLYLGSSCIYPRDCPQPIKEEYLLTGKLEPTNQAYAIAKLSGLLSCQAYRDQYGCSFISAMPTNLYGPGDNFNLHDSHVVPALLRKFHEARLSGAPMSRSGVPGNPSASSFTSTIWLAPACSCSNGMTSVTPSTWGPARTSRLLNSLRDYRRSSIRGLISCTMPASPMGLPGSCWTSAESINWAGAIKRN